MRNKIIKSFPRNIITNRNKSNKLYCRYYGRLGQLPCRPLRAGQSVVYAGHSLRSSSKKCWRVINKNYNYFILSRLLFIPWLITYSVHQNNCTRHKILISSPHRREGSSYVWQMISMFDIPLLARATAMDKFDWLAKERCDERWVMAEECGQSCRTAVV